MRSHRQYRRPSSLGTRPARRLFVVLAAAASAVCLAWPATGVAAPGAVTFTAQAAPYSAVTTPEFTFSASGAATYKCGALDKPEFMMTCTSPYRPTIYSGGSHRLVVRGVDSSGNLGPPAVSRFVVCALGYVCNTSLPAPAGVAKKAATRTTVTLSHTPPPTTSAVYMGDVRASRADNTGGGMQGGFAKSATEFDVYGLECGTAYVFELHYRDGGGMSWGNGPPIWVEGSTASCSDTPPPAAPANVRQVGAGLKTIALAFDKPASNVTLGYWWATAVDRPGSGMSSPFAPGEGAVELSQLECGTEYIVKLQFKDDNGREGATTEVRASTTSCGGGGGGPGGGSTGEEPPRADLTIPGQKLRAVLKKGLAFRFDTNLFGKVAYKVALDRKVAKRLKLAAVVAKGSTGPRTGASDFVAKLSKKAKAKLRRLRKVRLTVTARVVSPTFGSTLWKTTKSITLKR